MVESEVSKKKPPSLNLAPPVHSGKEPGRGSCWGQWGMMHVQKKINKLGAWHCFGHGLSLGKV